MFDLVFKLLKDIWEDPTSRIIFATTIVYIASYLIYSGYIARFAGGLGGITYSRIGFTLYDILTLVPTAFITVANISRTAPTSLIKLLRKPFVYFLVVPTLLCLGLITLYSLLPFDLSPVWYSSLPIIGNIFFFTILLVLFFSNISQNNKVIIGILAEALWFFFHLVPFYLTNSSEIPLDTNSFNLINQFLSFSSLALFVVISLLGLFLFGSKIAEIAITENLLSKVYRIELKQPIEGLGQLFHVEVSRNDRKKFSLGWLTQPQIPIDIQPNTYSFNAESTKMDIYLITTSSSTTLFYIPPESENLQHGRMLMINNDLICAIEVMNRPIKN